MRFFVVPNSDRPLASVLLAQTRPYGSQRMAIETTRWDAAEFLDSQEVILAYLEAVFEDGDAALIAQALNDAARAKGVAHDALAAQSDIVSVIRILNTLGLELTVKAPEIRRPRRRAPREASPL
jgi:DNA-binding phage protein